MAFDIPGITWDYEPEKAPEPDPAPVSAPPTLEWCMKFLAGSDLDRARKLNGVGFNKQDSDTGHLLAETPFESWATWKREWAFRKVHFYRRQFEAAGIDIDGIDAPPERPAPVPEKEIRVGQDGRFEVYYAHLPEADFRAIRSFWVPGREWAYGEVGARTTYRVAPSRSSAVELRKLAADHAFAVSDEAKKLFFDLVDKGAQNVARSLAVHPNGNAPDLSFLPSSVTPWDCQVAGLEYIMDGLSQRLSTGQGPAVLNGDGMGLGKTLTAICAAQLAGVFEKGRLPGGGQGLLVICPATLKLNWAAELRRALPHLKIVVTDGGSAQPVRGDVVICNYENIWWDGEGISSPLVMMLELRHEIRPFAGVICDESHKLKDPHARRTQGVSELLSRFQPPFLLFLSGSPVLNRADEILPQLKMLGLDAWIGSKAALASGRADHALDVNTVLRESGGYLARAKEDKVKDTQGRMRTLHQVWDLPTDVRERNDPEELRSFFEARGWTYYEGALRGLKGKTVHTLNLPLTAAGRARYDEIFENFQAWLMAELGDSDEGLAAIARKLQAEVLVWMLELEKAMVAAKMPAVMEWAESALEQGEKLVLFCDLDSAADALKKRFPQAAEVRGGQSQEERDRNWRDRFQEGDASLLIAKTKAGGEGINLTTANQAGIVELGWNHKTMEQAEDRLYRGGQARAVTITYLCGEGENSIDLMRAKIIDKKRDTVEALSFGGLAPETSFLADLLTEIVAVSRPATPSKVAAM